MMEEENKKKNLATPAAIIVAGLVIAGAIAYGNYLGPSAPVKPDATLGPVDNFMPVSPTDHRRGPAEAALTIVEYSDLECPFCRVFHQTMLEIMTAESDVAWVYRHFPIESLHKKARREAIAAECATVQGDDTAFWKYIDELFAVTPSNDGLDPAELPKIAARVGLDVAKFNSCLAEEDTVSRLNADYDSGVKIGVDGTPFVLVVKDNLAYPIFRYEVASDIPDREVATLAEKIFSSYEKNIQAARN